MTKMHQPTILIAEDDPDDALMLKDAFSEINQTAITFLNNGKQLIEHIQKLLQNNEQPNLVVIDLNMPVLDGRGVINELKKSVATQHIPLVVLSTTKDKDDIAAIIALGASDFFTKPSSFNDLVKITNTIANKWLNT